MQRVQPVSTLAYVAAAVLLTGAILLIPWPGTPAGLFRTDAYQPHGASLDWSPGLIWLHAVCDLLIGVAYVAISATLAYLVYRTRQAIPFHWVLLCFGAFIVACGGTHFMEILTLWLPLHWLAGNVKIVTAVASVATAALLPPLVPRAVALVEAAQRSEQHRTELASANADLRGEIARREAAEAELLLLNSDLEARVAGRTAELQATTRALEAALAARDEFLAVAAHELKTPMTSLRGYNQLLIREVERRGSPEPERLLARLRLVEQQSDRLGALVARLLDISRLESGRLALERAPTDLVTLVGSAVERARLSTRRHTVRLNAPPTLTASVDAVRLDQVLTNLLDNALRYSPDDGVVDVSLSETPAGARIAVRDRGPGIDVADQQRIFERYVQLGGNTSGGFGLGLFLSREIVDLHGGRIAVETPTDGAGGARFIIDLPLHPPTDIQALMDGLSAERT